MSSFYELNYPREPYEVNPKFTEVQAPTLVIHGVKDKFLLASGHERNRDWLAQDPQTVMLDAGHFVHQEKPQEVNRALLAFLTDGVTEQSPY